MKNKIKNLIGATASNFNYPLVVNSYGRSGSTVLTNSIVKNSINIENTKASKIASRSISQSAWSLDNINLKNGIIYKTHDYPPEEVFNKNIRMLYTFADPIDVVLSLIRLWDERGEEWTKKHHNHLKVPFDQKFKERIIEEDILKLEQHLESWLQEDRFQIAFIKYEAMWDHQNDISEFLGFQIALPPFRERKTKISDHQNLIQTIEKTYSVLREKFLSKDSFFMN